jgi:hypothetical protein
MKLVRSFIIVITLLLSFSDAKAQERVMNMAEHDNKKYYFGLTFGLNFSTYRIRYSKTFVESDTFKRIQPRFSPGFNLGLMGNLRLSSFVDLRFVPSLSFAGKPVEVVMPSMIGSADSSFERTVESIYMHLPLQLKFKSDRIKNFRFYGMAGYKFDIDLAANARSRRTDEFLKVKPIDMGYELGAGFEFYYPNFIFSPEIKLSQGLMNQQFKDSSIPLSNAIESLSTRMIVISIHLEG